MPGHKLIRIWSLTNGTVMDHPFHMHGFFFQVLDPATGAPAAPREWKDTVNIPANHFLQMLVKYDDRPGMWMWHCHVLEHAEKGLLGMLHVHPMDHLH